MISEDRAENSARETAINMKNQIRRLGFQSPDISQLWGCRVDNKTTFYYSSCEKRQQHLPHIRENYGNNFELIDPIENEII